MTLDDNWFTEICKDAGSAFSLKITAKLHEEKTDYQTIAIYDTQHYGRLMTIDGLVMLTGRDNFLYHEMMSHPALFTHPNPQHVVIIGGGDCGTLREVLKHDGVKQVSQIEIDERVTRLSERYFPELCESNHDPRAKLLFIDGIQWMKDAADKSVDVIIIDSTDPVGPAEGLFGEAFFRDCFRVLSDNGLMVQQSESPLFHMRILKDIYAAYRKVGFTDIVSMPFPQSVYPSGWWSATMALKTGKAAAFRDRDAANKSFDTVYYNAALHRGALAMPEFMLKALK